MATGRLGVNGEHDWFRLSLLANQAYLFTITGLSNQSAVKVGTVAFLNEGGSASRALVSSYATPQTETVWFTPATAGTYYLDVSDPDTVGPYTITAAAVANDFRDDATTTGSVAVGGPATNGTLGQPGERDAFRVSLTANQAYLFTATGLSTLAEIRVAQASGLLLAGNQGAEQALPANALPHSPQTQTVWFTPGTTRT